MGPASRATEARPSRSLQFGPRLHSTAPRHYLPMAARPSLMPSVPTLDGLRRLPFEPTTRRSL